MDELTLAQQAIWFEGVLRPEVSNTGFFSVSLTGEADLALILRSCAAIVARHPALRCLVRLVDGQPWLQELPSWTPIGFQTLDLECPPGEEMTASAAWQVAAGKQSWDLTRETPIHFTLLRHGPGRCTLVVAAHHLCFDGRSKFLFAREFGCLMSGGQLDPGPVPTFRPLPDLEALHEANVFWGSLDLGSVAPLGLPHGPGPDGGGPIGTVDFGLPSGTQETLRELAAAAGTNLFGGLLAALGCLFYAYGNERMVFTLPADVSSRLGPPSIGLAVNSVPVYLQLPRAATFAEALAAGREACAQVRRFRSVPFTRLAAAGARNLFGSVSVSFMRAAVDIPAIAGLQARWNFLAPNTAQTCDLMFHLRDAPDGIPARLDHRRQAVGPEVAQRVVTDLETILAAALKDPARRVDELLRPARPTAHLLVVGPGGNPLPPGLDGQLVMEGEYASREVFGRARVGPSGEIVFLGNESDTITWAGLSVNLREAERLLMLQPGVASASAWRDGNAFAVRVTARRGHRPDPTALRRLLKRPGWLRLSTLELADGQPG
ncbi:hypothetical protein Rhe02_00830 [Rhizocola hellebori]|uniref:Condensation domain-containing protein n=1 Tax=Rhizocola hellebori TaxID=1392758 RepID=A0A8J3Q267_9ACTN|nr:condensation domain-containing protein [Rhizocola hellebori]GIH02016.1 hypothetical protein Rhe02_00830 [Rhizocola hellebori]